jgi:nucleoside-diphosphate-sugar epimerase
MSKILITGALGHISSYLINELRDHDITMVDNLLTQRYCTLFNVPKNCEFVENGFENLSVDYLNNFDIVIHLAGIVNAPKSFEDKKEVRKVNIDLTKLFISKVNQSTVKLLIFPSSTSVYGKSRAIMYEDEDNVMPQSPYADSKRDIEVYLQNGNVSMNYIIFRFGTIFGTSVGMRFQTVINKFCYQAAFGVPLTVWKNVYHCYRPYLGLQDACTAITMAIDKELPYNNIYNVLTGNYKLSEVIETIKKYVPTLKVNFVDTPILNQNEYEVSDKKIRKHGYYNKTELEEGIKDTLELLGAI